MEMEDSPLASSCGLIEKLQLRAEEGETTGDIERSELVRNVKTKSGPFQIESALEAAPNTKGDQEDRPRASKRSQSVRDAELECGLRQSRPSGVTPKTRNNKVNEEHSGSTELDSGQMIAPEAEAEDEAEDSRPAKRRKLTCRTKLKSGGLEIVSISEVASELENNGDCAGHSNGTKPKSSQTGSASGTAPKTRQREDSEGHASTTETHKSSETASPQTKSPPKVAQNKGSHSPHGTKTQSYNKLREHKLSGYNKKRILDHLKQHGCSAKSFREALCSFRVNERAATEELNKCREEAQQYVHQECDSLSFGNITAWLQYLERSKFPDTCNFEPAIVLNEIVRKEQQPEPQEIGGVNLKAIYKFLANGLIGAPQPELDAISASFLADEFELLINEANTDQADAETRNMKYQLIEKFAKKQEEDQEYTDAVASSLDPLGLQPDMKL